MAKSPPVDRHCAQAEISQSRRLICEIAKALVGRAFARHYFAATQVRSLARAKGAFPNGRRPMQFVRVISRVEDMEIWNANGNGFSFVISYESHSGQGLQGRAGFVASWRPIYENRCAIKVGGSPFRSFTEAEEACKAMLGYLTISALRSVSMPLGAASAPPRRLR